MFKGAIYKRPKARLKRPGEELQIETNIRYVIPEVLQQQGKTLCFENKLSTRGHPPQVKLPCIFWTLEFFALRDTDSMKEWHDLSKRIKSTRGLTSWVQSKPESDVQRSILSTLPMLNIFSAFKTRIAEIIVQFHDLTRFAGENWLCDGCVFVAALHATQRAQLTGTNRVELLKYL
ncbi:hypothetical protein PPTG_22543 [Phytophthora nicotianae INRA-310]|uniref:PiggyBac transposable element-derived protein domain-containing protein n=1 Tax=Phytophthora nicotianae (strain INRA-310) TaxID=761204 RepID=W2QHU3_PHYN3|nr:hypothetical protein PPTG_22543 [Phytophthora nicotianae INRA-310]ETN11820.1 hypothetical protein PPTG_22543 [Phytophthora nicotianae INRA-310]